MGLRAPLIPQYQTPHIQPCTPPVWWPVWSWSASCGATCEDCSSRHESCLASHRRAALLLPAYTGGPDQHTLTHHQTTGGPPSLATSASHLGSGSHCCSARHFWLRWCLFLLYLIQLLLHPSGLCIIVRLVPSALKKCPSFLQMETTILLQHLHILTHGYIHSNGRNPCRLKARLHAQVPCISCSVCSLSTQQGRCWSCLASLELLHDSTGAEGAVRASATPTSFRFEGDERIKRHSSKGET